MDAPRSNPGPTKTPAEAERGEPGRLPEDGPRPRESDTICWCCGGRTVSRHCKIICGNWEGKKDASPNEFFDNSIIDAIIKEGFVDKLYK